MIRPGILVSADVPQTRFLSGVLNGIATGHQAIVFEVENTTKVTKTGASVPYTFRESGPFPIVSDINILFEGTATREGYLDLSRVSPMENDLNHIERVIDIKDLNGSDLNIRLNGSRVP